MSRAQFKYPDLPISRSRKEIAKAIAQHQVVIVVGETGSGKTTQLPKIAQEVATASGREPKNKRGRAQILGCTQPRRIAAVAVARRIAEEVGEGGLGDYVGYQVRFDDRSGADTRIKLMTDGILLAETQDDRDLSRYHTIILDEAHERSLNIDFLLGYMKLLLARRPDLKLIISSATMDAAAFADFFGDAPVIHVEGRTFPVEMHYMPPRNREEELSRHVVRAVEWLSSYDSKGDVLVFLPGEREIRDCASDLEAMRLPKTDILPLFARLGLSEQQRIFQPKGGTRRIVLATNVAETSLTIPGIIYVIDSGLARISRYLPGRQIQRLQVEDISQASARQRAGRCGRVCEGVCIRLYSEEDFDGRDAFTDPEIKRSALAGVILRMADLRLPPLGEFPLPDPPSPRLINEGYKTLREIGALDRKKDLTDTGRTLARLPLDPRLGRMLLEGKQENALAEMLVIVAGLSIMDPRERPSDAAAQADQAQAQWRNEESDFLSLLSLWQSSLEFREGHRGWKRNQLRKWCQKHYLNFLRIIEWHNLAHDLAQALAQVLRWRIPALPAPEDIATSPMIHRSILAGAPLQIGFWRPEEKSYRGCGGRDFGVFPGSGLFKRKKRAEWILGSELVETTRLWMRRCALLDPVWVEQVAPQLCTHHAYAPRWDKQAGQVFAKERVSCGGLCLVEARRVSYARLNPKHAKEIFIREAIMEGELKDMRAPFLQHITAMKDEVSLAEAKLRRRNLLWCSEGVYAFFNATLPDNICSEKALRQWRDKAEKQNKKVLFVPRESCTYPGEDDCPAELYPDEISIGGEEYPVYYAHDPAAADDGVTLGVHIDQLARMPEWLPAWGVPAHLPHRVEVLLRALPKDIRNFLLPLSETAEDFAEYWEEREPDRPLEQAIAEFVMARTGGRKLLNGMQVAEGYVKLLPEHVTKLWVCDDEGNELALGTNPAELLDKLGRVQEQRFKKQAARAAESKFSRSPITRWDCGDLPKSVQLSASTGYPALRETPDGSAAQVHVFATEEEATAAHRIGVRRLLLTKHGDFVNHFLKAKNSSLPITAMEDRLALSTLGMAPKLTIKDMVFAGMELAITDKGKLPLPRTAAEFDQACLRLREGLFDCLKSPIARLWSRLVEVDVALREYILTAQQDRFGSRIAAELQQQWNWLTRPWFFSSTGAAHLNDLDRFARGILERIRRIKEQPAARELERMAQLEAAIAKYYERPELSRAYEKQVPLPAHILQYGLMVEEYRLTLFAPALAIKGRASAKKLEALREK